VTDVLRHFFLTTSWCFCGLSLNETGMLVVLANSANSGIRLRFQHSAFVQTKVAVAKAPDRHVLTLFVAKAQSFTAVRFETYHARNCVADRGMLARRRRNAQLLCANTSGKVVWLQCCSVNFNSINFWNFLRNARVLRNETLDSFSDLEARSDFFELTVTRMLVTAGIKSRNRRGQQRNDIQNEIFVETRGAFARWFHGNIPHYHILKFNQSSLIQRFW